MTVHQFIDRRRNPRDKSLGNRQRFMKRARAQIKKVIDRTISENNIADVADAKKISIPTKGIREPRFRQDSQSGTRERVLPGNKEFVPGDEIPKPQSGAGGTGGKEASDSGEGLDEFEFVISRDEFLDLFFEDLELPDLIKRDLKEIQSTQPRRAGYRVTGNPSQLALLRTMRSAQARRMALHRPRNEEILRLEARLAELRSKEALDEAECDELRRCAEELARLESRRKRIPFIDPLDIRYKNFVSEPKPNTKAVMFCLMDVSASMGEREKDLAKRFFILLHLFLMRRYSRIDLVFIRHTHEAAEVDEQTFFYGRETGGTKVSSALQEMKNILAERYPRSEWNVYAAQASDGDNLPGDGETCLTLLCEELMPLCQYFAYVEILDPRERNLFLKAEDGTSLWRAYKQVGELWPNFEMKRITESGDIYPVFRELFSAKTA